MIPTQRAILTVYTILQMTFKNVTFDLLSAQFPETTLDRYKLSLQIGRSGFNRIKKFLFRNYIQMLFKFKTEEHEMVKVYSDRKITISFLVDTLKTTEKERMSNSYVLKPFNVLLF